MGDKMKKALYLILLCLILAPAAMAAIYQTTTVATTAVANVCYTTDQLNTQIRDCEAKGMTYSTYYTGNCKYVKCYEQTPCPTGSELEADIKDCEAKGMTYSTTIRADCKYIQCEEKPTTTCPTEEELQKRIANCPDDFQTYMDDNGCKIKYCKPTVACPTSAEYDKMIAQCPETYRKYEDNNGCTQIACPTTTCPSIDEAARKCKAANLEYDTYADDSGCKRVTCRNNEKVECKKYVLNGCVIISCIDGWTFNSCEFCGNTGECKSYTDADGCAVRECTDGTSTKACPVTATAPTSGGQATAVAPSVAEPAEAVGINPQPEPPKTIDVANCVKDLVDKGNKIDDEVTWSKCKKQYKLTNAETAAVDDMKNCAKDSTEIDDEVTWSKCKDANIPTTETTDDALTPGGVKAHASGQEVQLNPQPEPPAPSGFFGKIGAWFSGWFK